MSLIIRSVDYLTTPKVEEHFLGFLKVEETTGLGIFEELKNLLEKLKIDFNDIIGQGYDNGSNMKRKNKGVQNRLLKENPREFYMSCACHSLNLMLLDMDKSCPKEESFFSVMQRIYKLFSKSTKRWQVFKKHVTGFTVKPLSDTRWESHIESVKEIRFQLPKIRDALLELSESIEFSAKIRGEADSSLTREIDNFEFIFGMVVWHHFLLAVNSVSKFSQKEDMHLDIAMDRVNDLLSFFVKCRDTGFEELLEEATELAATIGIEPSFYEPRIIRKRKHFDDIMTEEEAPLSGKRSFEVNYFNYIVDQARSSLASRFEQFHEFNEVFGFLFQVKKLHSLDDSTLKACCIKLQNYLKHGMSSDIDGHDLYAELKVLKSYLPEETERAIEVLNFLKDMEGCYPNA
ncbi:zinc finger MYM-type protein 1-like [Papaver somniferum]|uniref:zinc finger MYM-type protein 1-like n=1 Tax=Papaver somniferum TaxID=3469 RepID=UPI000E6FA47D|nr:zinc finger MYM-type protein 1-like [Papaver somniferum]